jgi:4'-phosphopantetheinyl transferase
MLESAVTDIDVWLVDDREVADTALLDNYHQLLNAEESDRHQRFVFARHRHQFLVTRALVRCTLAQYLGLDDPAAVAFSRNDHGKPLLVADSSLQFNLTHTNGLIALAVTPENTVGIDVEFLSRQVDVVKLAERYFSKAETAALLALPVAKWNQRFYDLWTLKEAYLKACGTGLKTPLNEFSFRIDGDGINIGFSKTIADDPHAWQFWQLDVENAYRLSLAVNDPAGNTWRLKFRKGIPLQDFTEISPTVIR